MDTFPADKRRFDSIGSGLIRKRWLDRVGSGLIRKRWLDRVGSGLLRKRTSLEDGDFGSDDVDEERMEFERQLDNILENRPLHRGMQ